MTELERLKERLYGPNGLGVKNFRFDLAENCKATPEEIARDINKSLDAIEAGEYTELESPGAYFND
jgi:hypothetical protein